MMNCTLIRLNEQKYMGISTQIFFRDHDAVDFKQLQQDVAHAGIPNVDPTQRFMALDTDFQPESFRYAPLVPVTAFSDGDFFRYTREAGEYYCFPVQLKELNPQWFQACFSFMEQQNIQVDRSYDLEYYPEGYLEQLRYGTIDFSVQTIKLLFRKL
jgi:hypothetical protein